MEPVEFQILSMILVVLTTIIIKIIEKIKFKDLVGSSKATNVIIFIVLVAETIYLTTSSNLITYVLETVTSLSAILLFLTFVYLSKLQNAVSGLSIALSTKINVGDKITVEEKTGIIIQIGLTKTIVKIEDGQETKLYIPNKKFDENILLIRSTKTCKKHSLT